MKQYTTAIRSALDQKNWLAALTLALMMPDVCGGLETPGSTNSKQRSVRWFDQHMRHHYTVMQRKDEAGFPPQPPMVNGRTDTTHPAYPAYQQAEAAWRAAVRKEMEADPVEEIWLNGADCYALRCALLHEGSDQTDRQKAKDAIDAFTFLVSSATHKEHNSRVGIAGERTYLALDVATFCTQIADAVDTWVDRVKSDRTIQQEMSRLLKIVIL